MRARISIVALIALAAILLSGFQRGVQVIVSPAPVAGGGHTFTFTSSANTHCSAAVGGTSPTCTLGAAPGSGKFVVVGVVTVAQSGSLTVDDNGSCSASHTTSNGSSGTNDATAGSSWIFFLSLSGTCGTVWRAVAANSTTTAIDVNVITIATGAGAVIQDGGDVIGSTTTGTSISTPTVPSTTAGDLQICFSASENDITSANSPWTTAGTGAAGSMLELILSSSAGQACNFTQNTGHADETGAAFK